MMADLVRLLEILACPRCKGDLQLADKAVVLQLNQQLSGEKAVTSSGITQSASKKAMEAAFVCNRCCLAFPVIDGIPDLVLDDAIPLSLRDQEK
jgi:uncharacterized protein YbaR (Trm112 family)